MKSTKTTPKPHDDDMTSKCSVFKMGLCSVKECDKDCAENYSIDEIIEEVKSWG